MEKKIVSLLIIGFSLCLLTACGKSETPIQDSFNNTSFTDSTYIGIVDNSSTYQKQIEKNGDTENNNLFANNADELDKKIDDSFIIEEIPDEIPESNNVQETEYEPQESNINFNEKEEKSSKKKELGSDKIIKNMNEIGLDIFINSDLTENRIISPVAIFNLLGVLDNAQGKNNNVYHDIISPDSSLVEYNSYMGQLNQVLKYQESVKLKMNNYFILDTKVKASEGVNDNFYDYFIPAFQTYYLGEYTEKNFDDENEINKFVSYLNKSIKFNGNSKVIENLFAGEKKNATLLNLSSFTGRWKNKFNSSNTKKEIFYEGTGNERRVEMMNKNGNFKCYKGDYFKSIEIPFADDEYVMDIITTLNYDYNINEITKKEIKEYLLNVINSDFSEVEFKFPKNNLISTTYDLNQYFDLIGIEDSYNINYENIDEKFKIQNIISSNILYFDENGAETSALDYQDIELSDNKYNFYTDRPFIFVIRDPKTDMILFIGNIQDLNEKTML